MQRLLTTARWDPAEVRDDLRAYVVEHLGDPGGVLVVDETGFLKKGTKSVGVQRQYSGTAGRIENCQIGVFLAYAGRHGHALVDRELYLPEAWTADRRAAMKLGSRDQVGFQTKPQLARRHAGAGPGRQGAGRLGDRRCGLWRRWPLRRWLESATWPMCWRSTATELAGCQALFGVERADQLAAAVAGGALGGASAPARARRGERLYDWARVASWPPRAAGRLAHWLLVRRSRHQRRAGLLRSAIGPGRDLPGELVQVAGSALGDGVTASRRPRARSDWTTTRCAAGQGWYRHITLAMLAHAFLTVTARPAAAAVGTGGRGAQNRPSRLVPLSVPEIRRLLVPTGLARCRPSPATGAGLVVVAPTASGTSSSQLTGNDAPTTKVRL